MQIGFTLFLVIDALDSFVDADGFICQRDVLHLWEVWPHDPVIN